MKQKEPKECVSKMMFQVAITTGLSFFFLKKITVPKSEYEGCE